MITEASHLAGGGRFHQAALFSARNTLFLSDDTQLVREGVSRVFKPHELKAARAGERVGACMHQVRQGRLAINRLEYSTEVDIDPGRLDDFYLIQIPIQGRAEIRCGNQRFDSTPEVASLISPDQPLRMRWAGGAPQLTLRIDKADMRYHCQQHMPQAADRLPSFHPQLQLSAPGGGYFLQLLGLMVQAMGDPQHPIHQPLVLRQLESTLLNALLYGQPLADGARLESVAQTCLRPYFVKRAEAYIEAHLHEPLSIETLAEQAGVSVRTLFAGFRNFRGTSPMAYLREQRLERVHQELAQGAQGSVTDIAFKWGFAHLGRFAQEYKRRYGQSPSATLRLRGELT